MRYHHDEYYFDASNDKDCISAQPNQIRDAGTNLTSCILSYTCTYDDATEECVTNLTGGTTVVAEAPSSCLPDCP